MSRKILLLMGIIFASTFFILGCATTRTKHTELETQKLRTQIQTMEQELKQSEKEIEDLEWQLEKERQRRRALEKELAIKSSTSSNKQTKGLPPASTKNIQLALRKAGFYNGAIDGKLGPRTKEALKAFQKARGLKADGIVGRETWQELARYLSGAEKTK